QIIEFLGRPAATSGIPLVAIDATEVFSLYFEVALATGICLSAPVILWQVWRFIEPALYRHEKRYAGPFIISTTICFVAGAVFGYGIVAPWLFKLEQVMAKEAHLQMAMSAESYFSIAAAVLTPSTQSSDGLERCCNHKGTKTQGLCAFVVIEARR